jgi:hypothetical protein
VWVPVLVVGGILGWWLSGDVCRELWGQCVLAGDVIPCCGLPDGTLGEEVGEEVDGVYPLRFTIAS